MYAKDYYRFLIQNFINIRVTDYTYIISGGDGRLGFDSRQGLGCFLFATASRPDLTPTQPLTHGYEGISPGLKWSGPEAN
jgi:hypothetical protein